jgi:hypothetical protein
MSKYKTVERRTRISVSVLDGPIRRVMKDLEELIGIYGEHARLQLDPHIDGGGVELEVIYYDLETEEEYDARMAGRMQVRQEKLARDKKAWETYLKLKARFEPNDEV